MVKISSWNENNGFNIKRDGKEYQLWLQISFSKEYNNSCSETLRFTLIGCLSVMIVCHIIDESHDRVSEYSMMHSNCRAMKPLSLFTFIVLILVVLLFVVLLIMLIVTSMFCLIY